jgi:SAM-dependent methyltransferase
MSKDQFNTYAKFYDLLYKDKNYAKEALYIDALVNKYFSSKNKNYLSLLDLACGTGKHLFELSSLGYSHVAGSDISASMIKLASSKAQELNKKIDFYNYSFQQANKVPGKFHVVVSMFSAINYITTLEDQLQAFKNIHGLLNDTGLFIFDYWNGNAVLRDYSPVKVLRKKENAAEIIRISETNIDAIKQDVFVKFSCLYLEEDKIIDQFEEIHHLHYYHFSEIRNLLYAAGFKIIHISPFMEMNENVSSHDWNVSIVAQKK